MLYLLWKSHNSIRNTLWNLRSRGIPGWGSAIPSCALLAAHCWLSVKSVLRRGFICMEPDTYITSHYGSSPFSGRVGIAKELQCSIRAQSQVPDHLTCSAPGSLCRVPHAIRALGSSPVAPNTPKINVWITSTNSSTTNLLERHNIRDESKSTRLESQANVT